MKLPVVSGKDCVKVAVRLGFEFRRQTGSHAILRKEGRPLTIPMHKTLKKGTLHQILKVLGITAEQFLDLL